MVKIYITLKRNIAAFWLIAYLFITGYSLFHFHETNYIIEQEINIEGKAVTDSGFHHSEFCQLFNFNSTQLTGDLHLISDCSPAEIIIQNTATTFSLISPYINSLLLRGPPFLS